MITKFEIDRALMAGRAYQTNRDPNEINWFTVPAGWIEFFHVPGSTKPTTSGFEAVAFQKSSEIVIAFAGTNPNDLSGDMTANIGLATGFGSAQLLQAAEYYLQVQAVNPGAAITFTGHSLGGGLAALMGVFFGRQAITFDQAPFANSAEASLILPDVAANLRSYLVAQLDLNGSRKYSDTVLQGLTDFLAIRAALPMGEIPNTSLVTSINVDGEFLSGVPYSILDRIGLSSYIPTSAPGVSGDDLHSQALLTAFLQSMQTAMSRQTLNGVTFKLTDLIGMIFSPSLYKFDTDTATPNFLERLVQNETSNAMVTRFTADLWKLAQEGGLTMADDAFASVKLVSQTLIAFAMQKYYTETQTSAGYNKELFTDVTGGIRFDRAEVAANLTDTKGYSLYFHHYLANSFSPSDRDRIESVLPGLRDWYVQAGASGMDATDAQNRGAFMLGGLGADALTGGTGADLLVGNTGFDRLTGGAGTDTLMGGQGFDRYYWATGDGHDLIEDADATGAIFVNGQMLVGGVKNAGQTDWVSADGTITYEMVGTDLVVKLNGTQILTVNENFERGQFGIELFEGPDMPSYDNRWDTRRYYWESGSEPDGPVSDYPTENLVNILLYGSEHVDNILAVSDMDGNDQVYGYGGGDHIMAGFGHDRVYGGDGPDWIVGGYRGYWDENVDTLDGDDYLDGENGNDSLSGLAGNDHLFGGAGSDTLMGDSDTSVTFYVAPSGGDDFLEGGIGNDSLYGDYGADVLIGGADDDVLRGDYILHYQAPGPGVPQYLKAPVPFDATRAQDDFLDGGAGNDEMYGDGGDDTLIGGAGDDLLVGDYKREFYVGTGWTDDGIYHVGPAWTDEAVLEAFGHDVLEGGDGEDELNGQRGDDVLAGGADNDILFGDVGADTLFGNEGDDYLYGDTAGPGMFTGTNDFLDGGAGNDQLLGESGDDVLVGGLGNDLLIGGDGLDELDGGEDDDELQGGSGNDVLFGGTGDDRLFGEATAFQGLAGDDSLFGGEGNDELQGNAGHDVLTGDAGDDRLFGQEGHDELFGGEGNDGLRGDEGDDQLDGGAGDDILVGDADGQIGGTGGNDTLTGGAGNDTLVGGGGQDTYIFNLDDGRDTLVDAAGEGNRLIVGVEAASVTLGIEAGDTLLVRVGHTGDVVQISGFDGIDQFEFSDGTVLTSRQLIARGFHQSGTTTSETLTGSAWIDHIAAGAGNDVVSGHAGSDTLVGEDGNDVLLGDLGDDTLDGGAGHDRLSGGEGTDQLFGGLGDDVLMADLGTDRLVGGAGNDIYELFGSGHVIVEAAGEGSDTVRVGIPGTFVLPEAVENIEVREDTFLSGAVDLVGNQQNNRMTGSDLLDGWHGNDTLIGIGDNCYVFGRGYGQDVIQTGTQTYATKNFVDYIQLLAGVAPTDVTLEGHGNHLVLKIVGTSDQIVIENYLIERGLRTPTVGEIRFADGTIWGDTDMAARVRVLHGTNGHDILTGLENDNDLFGHEGDDGLLGYGGADRLEGGAGNDVLIGGDGNDIYLFGRGDGQDSVSDVPDSWTTGEVDTVRLDSTITPADIRLQATADAALLLTINGTTDQLRVESYFLNQIYQVEQIQFADGTIWDAAALASRTEGPTLVGTDEADSLMGMTTNDTLSGLAGDDLLSGQAGNDLLVGGEGHDALDGGSGNDTLDGGLGSDTLMGGSGNDSYVVDDPGDVVTEYSNRGTDTVHSSITYTLGAHVEHLTLTGSTAINGTGNGGNNTLTGNSAANVLTGGTGNDTYVVGPGDTVVEQASAGMDGVQSAVSWTLGANIEQLTLTGSDAITGTGNTLNNTLTGNAGNNVLDGGMGNDTMRGGLGNDTYVVNTTSDVVTEQANEGTDTVQSAVTYTLGANLENLTLTGTGALNGTGNTLNNVLIGNSAANTLTGGAGQDTLDGGLGNDTLRGGTGNDTYVVNTTGDLVTEYANEGTDLVQSSVTWTLGANLENLTLTGTATSHGTGNTANNILTGNRANNILTGLGGNDTYRYSRGGGQDTVVDHAGTADAMVFGATINPGDLVLSRQVNDLRLAIHGSTDRVTIQNWYSRPTNQTETIQAGNGQTLLHTQVEQLIQAMAAFSQQTGLTWDQALDHRPQDVQAVLAASWQ